MSDVNAPVVASAPVIAAPPAPQFPADYEELRAFKQSVEEKVLPYWDDIEPILSDEDTRTFTRTAIETYRDRQKRLEPELPPELAAFEKRLESKFGDIVEYVGTEKKTRAEAAAAVEKENADKVAAYQRSNTAYAERIIAERPEFAADDFKLMRRLAALTAAEGLSLEEGYKEFGTLFGVKPKAVEKPTSLRGDGATPGVPGESALPAPKTQRERLDRMRANMSKTFAAGGRG
jgi:hypothetical protein